MLSCSSTQPANPTRTGEYINVRSVLPSIPNSDSVQLVMDSALPVETTADYTQNDCERLVHNSDLHPNGILQQQGTEESSNSTPKTDCLRWQASRAMAGFAKMRRSQ